MPLDVCIWSVCMDQTGFFSGKRWWWIEFEKRTTKLDLSPGDDDAYGKFNHRPPGRTRVLPVGRSVAGEIRKLDPGDDRDRGLNIRWSKKGVGRETHIETHRHGSNGGGKVFCWLWSFKRGVLPSPLRLRSFQRVYSCKGREKVCPLSSREENPSSFLCSFCARISLVIRDKRHQMSKGKREGFPRKLRSYNTASKIILELEIWREEESMKTPPSPLQDIFVYCISSSIKPLSPLTLPPPPSSASASAEIYLWRINSARSFVRATERRNAACSCSDFLAPPSPLNERTGIHGRGGGRALH